LRLSFLKVDEKLRTSAGLEELAQSRREVPPKKPPIMSILGGNDK
jgi:hypothetical protein